MAKKLAVFDFDHTIVDDNTDIVARKLLRNEWIPESTKILYKSSGWTVYMQEIFKLLHKYHFSKDIIRNAITRIPEVAHIKDLIIEMVNKFNFDVIIISDSNTTFINDWLIANKMNNYIHSIFTNPSWYNDTGLLKLKMYHLQKECNLSTINLCKGKIMEEFIENQKDNNIFYKQVVYIGDGKNDFCPILRLHEKDLACVRDGYACVELVNKALEKKSEYTIKSNICIWKTGLDILKHLTN